MFGSYFVHIGWKSLIFSLVFPFFTRIFFAIELLQDHQRLFHSRRHRLDRHGGPGEGKPYERGATQSTQRPSYSRRAHVIMLQRDEVSESTPRRA